MSWRGRAARGSGGPRPRISPRSAQASAPGSRGSLSTSPRSPSASPRKDSPPSPARWASCTPPECWGKTPSGATVWPGRRGPPVRRGRSKDRPARSRRFEIHDLEFTDVIRFAGVDHQAHCLLADERVAEGRSLTATELAYRAGVSPPTASSHLAKLVQAKLLAVDVEGRYRHYRLAGPNVGHAVEAILALAGEGEEREEGARRRLGADFVLAARGKAVLQRRGVGVEEAERQRRAFARQCLDWTERPGYPRNAISW